MNFIVRALIKLGVLKNDLDYHLLRASMVIIFFFFGYQKWFEYEAQALLPYISHGPFIFWMYSAFGVRGATYFLGVAEWLFGAFLFAGYWNKKLGILGALGSCFTFIATTTIIPFMPGGWAASAGGFPAMTEKVAFLMKDLALFAVSVYLLRQDIIRSSLFKTTASESDTTIYQDVGPTDSRRLRILPFIRGMNVPRHQLPHQKLCGGVIFGYRYDGRSLEVYRYVSTQPQQKSEVEEPVRNYSSRAVNNSQPTIDEYLRKRLMPVEGTIPHLAGIEMYGNSVPAGTVGGDLFEYINFQQRYDVDARIQRAATLSKEFLEPLKGGKPARNSVDDHVEWLKSRPGFRSELEVEYRAARSSEQVLVGEDLHELYNTAGVLLVDAQGHGIISAKIASTVHDTFHALMLAQLDRHGKTTPELFERLNLQLAQSVTARNALGRIDDESAREIATMLYGEMRPNGHFRFVNFGHPPPLVFSAEHRKFVDVDQSRMAQFLASGLQIPEDHPDRTRYFSLKIRQRASTSDVADITL